MKIALVTEDGRVVNITDVPDDMIVVERGRFFEPPPGMRGVEATDAAVIGGTYVDGKFGPAPYTLEEKVQAVLEDLARIKPDGEAAAILAAEPNRERGS